MGFTITDVDSGNLASYQSAGCLGVQVGDRVLETDDSVTDVFTDQMDWKIGLDTRPVKLYVIGTYGRIRIYFSGGGGVKSDGTFSAFPMIITNAGGQVLINGDYGSASGFQLGGGKNIIVTGKYDPFLGTGNTNFQGHDSSWTYTRNYGIETPAITVEADSLNSSDDQFFDITINYLDVATRTENFAGVFIKSDGRPDPLNYSGVLRIHDCLMHNAWEGENIYIGNATGLTEHTIKLYFWGNRSINSAAEATQIGRLARGSKIFNNISINGGMITLDAFQQFQDGNWQFNTVDGDTVFENNIILGAKGNVLNMFMGASDDAGFVSPRKATVVNNNLLGDIGGFLSYFNSEVKSHKNNIEYTRNRARNKSFIRDRINDSEADPNYLISGNTSNVTDKISYVDNIIDYSIFLNPTWASHSNIYELNNQVSQTVPAPTFVNSGFNDATMDYTQHEIYLKGKGNVAGDEQSKFDLNNITWQSGNTVRYELDDTSVPNMTNVQIGDAVIIDDAVNSSNNGEFTITAVQSGSTPRYIEVTNVSRSNATDDEVSSDAHIYLKKNLINYPAGFRVTDPTTWEIYIADVLVDQQTNGIIEPGVTTGWESYWSLEHTLQPMDYRLLSTDAYNKLGIGLPKNQEPDTNTVIRWEWAHDDGGSPYSSQAEVLIYNRGNAWMSERLSAFNLAGKWLRKSVKVRSQDSREGNWLEFDWFRVPVNEVVTAFSYSNNNQSVNADSQGVTMSPSLTPIGASGRFAVVLGTLPSYLHLDITTGDITWIGTPTSGEVVSFDVMFFPDDQAGYINPIQETVDLTIVAILQTEVRMDFGATDTNTRTFNGDTIQNMQVGVDPTINDITGADSGLSITWLQNGGGVNTAGENGDTANVDGTAWGRSVFAQSTVNKVEIRFSGLGANTPYELTLSGSRGNSGATDRQTDVTIGGVTKSFTAAFNNEETIVDDGAATGAVQFTGNADGSGELTILVDHPNSGFAYMGWIILKF